MNVRVARWSGKIATVLGFGFAGFGVLLTLLTLVVDVPWGQLTGKALIEQAIALVLLNLAGLLAGVPFVIMGQIMLVLVRQGDVLERIAQALERRETATPPEQDPAPVAAIIQTAEPHHASSTPVVVPAPAP